MFLDGAGSITDWNPYIYDIDFCNTKKTLHMAIKINCIPSGTFPHFLEHEKEETLLVYLEAVKWALLEE